LGKRSEELSDEVFGQGAWFKTACGKEKKVNLSIL